MINKKVLLNRVWVGLLIGTVLLAMVILAAFDHKYFWFRYIDALIISVLTLLAVVEMRRALGVEKIPHNFSWLVWSYGIGIGPSYATFGFAGIVFLSLLIFAASTVTALRAKRADSLVYIAFMLVYPGLFMASMLYITQCASTHSVSIFSGPLLDYILSVSGKDFWALFNIQRITYLLPYNALGLALVFAVSTMTDVCAFVFGVLFGKHKLAPEISPKKTVEGAAGGIFGGLLGSAIVYLLFEHWKVFGEIRGLAMQGLSTPNMIFAYVVIGLAGSVMTQIGDLLASLVKRWCGIKDYSHILGEHGGIMDRFDGIMLNSVFVALVYMFII